MGDQDNLEHKFLTLNEMRWEGGRHGFLGFSVWFLARN